MSTALIDAGHARAMGLVHHIVPHEALDEQLEQTLADLLDNGPTALQKIKALFANLGWAAHRCGGFRADGGDDCARALD